MNTPNIVTPCINICRLGPNGVCVGCKRTLEEISNWVKMTDQERDHVMKREHIIQTLEDELIERSPYRLMKRGDGFRLDQTQSTTSDTWKMLTGFRIEDGIINIGITASFISYSRKNTQAEIQLYHQERLTTIYEYMVSLNDQTQSMNFAVSYQGPAELLLMWRSPFKDSIHISNIDMVCQ